MIEVVAAMIVRDDRILICQRPAHKARPLLWEFVGGKVEPGETKAEALRRECAEELAIDIQVEEAVESVDYAYPELSICLTLLRASITEGEPQLLEHAAMQWVLPADLPKYKFCPADQILIQKLTAR